MRLFGDLTRRISGILKRRLVKYLPPTAFAGSKLLSVTANLKRTGCSGRSIRRILDNNRAATISLPNCKLPKGIPVVAKDRSNGVGSCSPSRSQIGASSVPMNVRSSGPVFRSVRLMTGAGLKRSEAVLFGGKLCSLQDLGQFEKVRSAS